MGKILLLGIQFFFCAFIQAEITKNWEFQTGRQLNPAKFHAEVEATPLLLGDKVIVGGYDAFLYVFNRKGEFIKRVKKNGSLRIQGPINTQAIYHPTTKEVIVSCADGNLYVFDQNIELIKVVAVSENEQMYKRSLMSAPIILQDGRIGVGAADGYFYMLGPDFAKKWSIKISGKVVREPLLLKNGNIAVNSIFYHPKDKKYEIGAMDVFSPGSVEFNEEPQLLETFVVPMGDYSAPISWVSGMDQERIILQDPVNGGMGFFDNFGDKQYVSLKGMGQIYNSGLVTSNRSLVFATLAGHIYTYDQFLQPTGYAQFGTEMIVAKPIELNNGNILITTRSGNIYILNAEGNKLIEKGKVGFETDATGAYDPKTGELFIGGKSGKIVSLTIK